MNIDYFCLVGVEFTGGINPHNLTKFGILLTLLGFWEGGCPILCYVRMMPIPTSSSFDVATSLLISFLNVGVICADYTAFSHPRTRQGNRLRLICTCTKIGRVFLRRRCYCFGSIIKGGELSFFLFNYDIVIIVKRCCCFMMFGEYKSRIIFFICR